MEQSAKLSQLHDYLYAISERHCENTDTCENCPLRLAERQVLENYTVSDTDNTSRCAITFLIYAAKSVTL